MGERNLLFLVIEKLRCSVENNKDLVQIESIKFANYKGKEAQMAKFVSDRAEVGKGENVGCQHFLLSPYHFQKPSSSGSGLCSKGYTPKLLTKLTWQRLKNSE